MTISNNSAAHQIAIIQTLYSIDLLGSYLI